ncbi:MAG: hypothetical protein DI622_00885 [Chryseobacterium sp.]|uniref:hypothetical protein n=1 Tax=Chryseobacterium sp. TaxID=1871047 RepID=UPI000DB31DD5|nr:hypothetical protein [Chryseobacterium sp.]MPS63515.1 hypothetical protein [Chryseobacterium sp.]PZU26422.1 MAG: hypothetical protein DI622_00885 [Chryseobacterium sp.]
MKKLFLLVLFAVSISAFAQKFKIQSGDAKFLKGTEVVNVIFDYSEMKLMKENYTEEEYIPKRVEELNKKTEGAGDLWKKQWERSKEELWNPKFIMLFNKVLSKENINTKLKENAQSPYTLVVKVKWIYPGWDAGIMKQPAKVTTQLTFIETDSKKVVCDIESTDAPGDQWGSNFNNETRIGEGFAKTGKTLAQRIERDVK